MGRPAQWSPSYGPPTEPAQDGPASGGADPAPIFRERGLQSWLEHACNAPIVPAAWLGRPADESVPGFELPSRCTPTGERQPRATRSGHATELLADQWLAMEILGLSHQSVVPPPLRRPDRPDGERIEERLFLRCGTTEFRLRQAGNLKIGSRLSRRLAAASPPGLRLAGPGWGPRRSRPAVSDSSRSACPVLSEFCSFVLRPFARNAFWFVRSSNATMASANFPAPLRTGISPG